MVIGNSLGMYDNISFIQLSRFLFIWIQKIESNIQRDRDCDDQLIEMGWLPLHFWEHQINKNLDSCIKEILSYIPREFPITIKQ